MYNPAKPSQPISPASKNEQDDEELERALLLIQEIVGSVRKDVEMDSLEAAVSLLQDALNSKAIGEESQVTVYRQLIKALLVRYGLHGWIEDLDACLEHLTQDIGAKRIIKLLSPESDEDTVEVLLAAELIDACQNSINVPTLDTVVCIATEALSSYPGDKSTSQIASFWIVLGKVRVMKFLKNGEIAELDQATRALQQAELLCAQDSTLLYTCLTSLLHVEWLRFVECGGAEGLGQLWDYWDKATTVDEEGRNLSVTGTKMTQGAVEDAQLQSGIALLKASLRCRKEPHPRRWLSLCNTAGALHARFEVQGILDDLQECIALYREALHLNPPPHPNRSTSLNNLANALCTYFEHEGEFRDLEECIILHRESLGLCPPPHPHRARSLNNLANALAMRFDYKGEFRDIDECIKYHREGLQLHPRSHPDRSASLNNLANVLSTRFKHKGIFKDLEECITLHREALTLRPTPHPDRSGSLNNLANALSARFDKKGRFEDLEECITLHREALVLRPPPHPYRPKSINNLASALCTRFENKGAFEDLDECISLYQEALVLRPLNHPGRPALLNNLSGALCTRFEHKGALQDLEESIKLQREGLALRPLSHADRPGSLNNLASALSTRFDRKGSFEDLEECIKLHRAALALMAPPHLDRSTSLNNLATSLSTRFKHKSTLEDLEECISLHREALELWPPSHPDRCASLSNLASALSTRFDLNGAPEDLEECINLHRKALNAAPLSHAQRSELLNSLAVDLRTRFDQKGELQDLEECIDIHREALILRPSSHPDRSGSLNNLANALCTRFDHKAAFEDLEECLALGREALALQPLSHPDRPMSLDSLAHALYTRFDHKGLHQDLEECVNLRQEALGLRSPTHSNYSTTLNNLANALQTRFNLKGAIQDLEACINLHREALNLRPAPHPDRPGSLNNLATALSTHFDHNGAFEDLEECIALHREALALLPQFHPDRSMSLNNLASALSTRFVRKGTFEDLEECITFYQEALDLQPPPHPDRAMSLNNLANALSTRFEHKGASKGDFSDLLLLVSNANVFCHLDQCQLDIRRALDYLEEAAKYKTGSLIKRFKISRNWVQCARRHFPASTLDAHDYAMELLPQLASLDLTLQQRQDVLQHTQKLVRSAAKCAIEADKYDVAVTYLSTGRSVFWAQALQLRTPVDGLMVTYPTIASKFVSISQRLQNASYSERIPRPSPSSREVSDPSTYTSLHMLANQRQQVLDEIRRIPGHERFLLPPSFSCLHPAAKDRVIVLLNGSALGCDALVIHGINPVQCVPLLGNELIALERLNAMLHTLLDSGTRSIEIPQDTIHMLQQALGRDMVPKSSPDSSGEKFQMILGYLWIRVVEPVVKALGIEKTDSPKRIWWCPTGPFASLPIHAAGLYSEENEPLDCLFQYAVSSYCTSAQDLLHSPPKITKSFKMTAIIEPEAPNAATLPATLEELKRIEKHVPDQQYLIKHVGSKESPNQVDDLVSDIQESSFVHFGCHGMQNLKDPLESYLLLSAGRFTMSKIIRECRVHEGALAYLSACETAKGDDVRPDESLNLVATMMFAGFKSVVGTMWSILDEDAPIVADAFYRYLFRNGKEAPPDVRDAAYGLHLATKELRDRGKPFYSWVPYVHYGI